MWWCVEVVVGGRVVVVVIPQIVAEGVVMVVVDLVVVDLVERKRWLGGGKEGECGLGGDVELARGIARFDGGRIMARERAGGVEELRRVDRGGVFGTRDGGGEVGRGFFWDGAGIGKVGVTDGLGLESGVWDGLGLMTEILMA